MNVSEFTQLADSGVLISYTVSSCHRTVLPSLGVILLFVSFPTLKGSTSYNS